MMTNQTHEFPVIEGAAAPLRIEELAPVARFSLRARADRVPALSRRLGLELPTRIGDRAEAQGRGALCLGPDEWLLTAPEAEGEGIRADLAPARAEVPHSLVEISDREVGISITGPAALELLSIGCPRDLERLAPGRAVRTVFDTAQVVLWRDGPEAFRLDVWRSFAPHVLALLEIGRAEIAAGL